MSIYEYRILNYNRFYIQKQTITYIIINNKQIILYPAIYIFTQNFAHRACQDCSSISLHLITYVIHCNIIYYYYYHYIRCFRRGMKSSRRYEIGFSPGAMAGTHYILLLFYYTKRSQ